MNDAMIGFEDAAGADEASVPNFELRAMRVEKAAELLDVVPATVRREIARGNLRAVHVGRSVRITKNALLEYLGEATDE